jgi:hypothetical protein
MVSQHLLRIVRIVEEGGVGTDNRFAVRKRRPQQSMKGLTYDYRSDDLFKAHTGTGCGVQNLYQTEFPAATPLFYQTFRLG